LISPDLFPVSFIFYLENPLTDSHESLLSSLLNLITCPQKTTLRVSMPKALISLFEEKPCLQFQRYSQNHSSIFYLYKEISKKRNQIPTANPKPIKPPFATKMKPPPIQPPLANPLFFYTRPHQISALARLKVSSRKFQFFASLFVSIGNIFS